MADTPMTFAARRFERAWALSWSRIPVADRLKMCDLLERKPGTVNLCHRMNQRPGGETWAVCAVSEREVSLSFLAPFVEMAMPLEGVCAVVAHELGHLYRIATRNWTANARAEEHGTKLLASRWGFYPEAPAGPTWEMNVAGWQKRHAEWRHLTEDRIDRMMAFRHGVL